MLVLVSKGGTVSGRARRGVLVPTHRSEQQLRLTEVRFDKAQYEFILDGELYLVKNLAASQPISMPSASRPTRSARHAQGHLAPFTDQDVKSRYYTVRPHWSGPNHSEHADMGLVGFHIVHKLHQFPEWIWSTFEQVDNIERGPGAGPDTPISFNNGTNSPPTVGGFANRPKAKAPPLVPADQRAPAQVTRFQPRFQVFRWGRLRRTSMPSISHS